MPILRIKRVYEDATQGDGKRVLIDRVWPRGIAKDRAQLHAWRKDAAVSTELRKWFAHDPARWDEFQARYRCELDERRAGLADLIALCREHDVTIVYGARDEQHNNAVVLREWILERLEESDG